MEYRFEVAHGYCAIITGDDPMPELLLGEERDHAASLTERRQAEYVNGRLALRVGLHVLAGRVPIVPILSDARGAPVLPAGWVGSISHKGFRAAGLVAADTGFRVGIDLERAAPPRVDIAPRVLTDRERDRLAGLARDDRGRAVTLRFSIKEAIYKAIDPFVHRYVGFREVELDVGDDGTCDVRPVEPARLPLTIEAAWREHEGFWLATARAKPWGA